VSVEVTDESVCFIIIIIIIIIIIYLHSVQK